MANLGGQTVPRIEKSEHIGPDDTGDNIMAKRVANYIWDGSGWIRSTASSSGGATEYTDGDVATAHPSGGIPTFNDGGIIRAVSDTHPLPVNATVTATVDTTGLATDTNQTTEISKLTSIDGKITAVNTGAVVVSSSALPSGAATAAKQPALGTAGSASADVITVQGKASMTPLLVDASSTTQPISGSVTANAGTNLNTSALALDATLTGGTQKSKLVDSAGTNTAAVSAGGALKVDGSAATQPVSGTFWQATQPVSLSTNTPTLQSGSTTAVTQTTAANLNATVVGTGTLAVQVTSAPTTAVTGTFWQATQPVSLAVNTPVIATGTNSIGKVGTTSAAINVGQKTVSTTAVQISATSTVPTNGIIVQALSSNATSIFIGGTGVTTSTGFEIVAGQAMSFTCNLNTLYIVSASSTTDKVCYNVQ